MLIIGIHAKSVSHRSERKSSQASNSLVFEVNYLVQTATEIQSDIEPNIRSIIRTNYDFYEALCHPQLNYCPCTCKYGN